MFEYMVKILKPVAAFKTERIEASITEEINSMPARVGAWFPFPSTAVV